MPAIPALSAQAIQLLMLLLGVLTVLFVLSVHEDRRERIARRARDLAATQGLGGGTDDAAATSGGWRRWVMRRLSGLADHVPLFHGRQREAVQTQLTVAGFRQPHHLSVFLAIKFTCGAIAVITATFASEGLFPQVPVLRLALIFGGLFGGLVLPEMILDRVVKRRQRLLNRALPETLDLMVICTNAGYSLGASLQRVSTELTSVFPQMAEELQTTAHELQVLGDPVTVLRRLADRTKIPAIRSLVATLVQTQQYGTPITQALRTLAQSERSSRVLAMEERAAKLSVKITFPMMAFILPTVMIVAGGPAAIKLLSAFGN